MTAKRVVLLIIIALLVAILLPILIIALAFILQGASLSPEKAQAICHTLAGDARKSISSISEFRIIDSSETCQVVTDELNSKDYIAGAHFLLTKQTDGSQPVAITSADTTLLQKKLPLIQEAWSVRNIINADGQSYTICASTSAYIDNDGSFYSQGNNISRALFFSSKTELGYSDRCLE